MTSPSASLDMNHIPVQSESELQTQPSPVLMTTSHDLTLNEISTSITIDASHPNPTPPMTPPPPPPAILPISLPNSPTLLPSPSISPSCSFGHNVLPSSSPLSSPPASSSPHRSRTLTLSDSHRSRSRSLSRGISAIESPPRSVYASFNDQDAGTDADASAEQSFSGSSSGLHSLQSSPRSAVGMSPTLHPPNSKCVGLYAYSRIPYRFRTFASAWTHAYYVGPFFPRRAGVCKAGSGICESCSRAYGRQRCAERTARG